MLAISRRLIQLQIINHQAKKIQLREDMLVFYSHMHQNHLNFMLFSRTSNIFKNSTSTANSSVFSQRIKELVPRKLLNLMMPLERQLHSVKSLSSSLRFWQRIRDLYTLVRLPIDTVSFIKNSTRKRRLQSFQLRNSLTLKNLKYLQPSRLILKTKEKSSQSTTKLMKQSKEDFKCTQSLNSWTCLWHQELQDSLMMLRDSQSESLMK